MIFEFKAFNHSFLLRYLLEGITGYFTGSLYNDRSIRKKGYYGEGVPIGKSRMYIVRKHILDNFYLVWLKKSFIQHACH